MAKRGAEMVENKATGRIIRRTAKETEGEEADMRVIEKFIRGKSGNAEADTLCEDGIVVTDDFIAVIDGSTSKSNSEIMPGMKNGRYCMLQISDFIRSMSADTSLTDFCEQVTEAIHRCYGNDDTEYFLHPERRLCASAVIFSRQRKEIWMVGDCLCMIARQLYENVKPYEDEIAQRRAALFPKMLSLHPDMVKEGRIVHDYARDAILTDLIDAMQGENTTYAVIDGFPIFSPGVRVIPLPNLSNIEVVLSSDGYPFLKSTLKDSEEALQKLLQTDPFLISEYKATKGLMKGNVSFDDRSYIRFEV